MISSYLENLFFPKAKLPEQNAALRDFGTLIVFFMTVTYIAMQLQFFVKVFLKIPKGRQGNLSSYVANLFKEKRNIQKKKNIAKNGKP